jgi:hypothetical protein
VTFVWIRYLKASYEAAHVSQMHMQARFQAKHNQHGGTAASHRCVRVSEESPGGLRTLSLNQSAGGALYAGATI